MWLDQSLKVILSNQAFSKLIAGRSPKGMYFWDFDALHNEQMSKVVFKSAKAKGSFVLESEIKAKSRLHIEITITCIKIKNRPKYLLTLRPITQRKLLEEELLNQFEDEVLKRVQNDRVLSTLFDYAQIGMAIIDNFLNLVKVNSSFLGLFGIKGNKLPKEIHSIITQNENDYEFSYKKEDGSHINLLVHTCLIENPLGGTLLVAMATDITRIRQIEQAKKSQEQMLIQQHKLAAMGEMIGAIAHQWRQPLNALALSVQQIKELHKLNLLTTEWVDDLVNDSMEKIDFMSSTIDDFRSFFRTDKEMLPLSVVKSVEEVLDILAPQFKHYGISVNLTVSDDDLTIVGYSGKLKQCILNILSNAKDAITGNNQTMGNIDINVYKDDKIVIEISDNGGGISPYVIDRIFDPYFTTKEEGKGTGLGLYLTKTIIEQHMHGSLKVHNMNDGAVFTIRI